MPYRVGEAVFGGWECIEIEPGKYADVFIYPISYNAGLPPSDYCQNVRHLAPTLIRLRRGHSAIWIRLESPEALWFYKELRNSLRGVRVPVAVTIGDRKPTLYDFSFFPWTDTQPLTVAPPYVDPLPRQGVTDQALACLRVLARYRDAFTAEIASATGFSVEETQECMKLLKEKGLAAHLPAEMEKGRNFPFWVVKRAGISLAMRSWGVPPGFVFTRYREALAAPEGEHRRKSRLWQAWLRTSWGDRVEIYAGWTEVGLPGVRARPDCLCWGRIDDKETLFWLEVESGHSSRREIQDKIARRVRIATEYATEMNVNLVFGVLGMRWVGESAAMAFAGLLRPWTAAIVGRWSSFGRLPLPQWGQVRVLLD